MAGTNTLNAKQVGARVHDRRLEVGMSQRELASDGVSYAYISRIEGGHRDPSLSALVRIADGLRGEAGRRIERLEERLVELDAGEVTTNVDMHVKVVEDALAAMRELAADTTALYFLTGSSHSPCPVCGRHDNQGATDGTSNKAAGGKRRR